MTVVHLVPDQWGPFVDIHACLSSLSTRRDIVVKSRGISELLADPDVVLITWEMFDPGPPDARRAKVVHVFAEAMDEDLTKLLPDHRRHWEHFKDIAPNYDGVFAHTPWATEFIRKHTRAPHVFTMPLGWDAEAMGSPRWGTRRRGVAYHGSLVGRREEYVRRFANFFDYDWHDLTGSFGRTLLGQLDRCAMSFYLAHSPVKSFSTWRIWQCASTASALVVEGHDLDTDLPPECYFLLPEVTPENLHDVARQLEAWSRDEALCTGHARALHEHARQFTMDRVHDRYVMPAIERILS